MVIRRTHHLNHAVRGDGKFEAIFVEVFFPASFLISSYFFSGLDDSMRPMLMMLRRNGICGRRIVFVCNGWMGLIYMNDPS